MKQLFTVLGFEFYGYVRKKAYIVTTIIVALLAALVIYLPRFSALWKEVTGNDIAVQQMLVVAVSGKENTMYPDRTAELVSSVLNNYKVEFVDTSERAEVDKKILDGSISKLIEIKDDTSYNVVSASVGVYDDVGISVRSALERAYREGLLKQLNASDELINSITTAKIDMTEEVLKSNVRDTFAVTYAFSFVIYMIISIYSMNVSAGIVSEKTNRAVEVLTTSADTNALIFGKVFGVGLASIFQVLIILIVALISFVFSKDYIQADATMAQITTFSAATVIYMLLFLIAGFFVYAFTFAIVGAMCGKAEDIASASMPVTLFMIAAFFITISFMLNNDVSNVVMKVLSYVPFTSPWGMFIRGSTGDAGVLEVIISLVVLAAFIFFEGVVAAKIYRSSILNYGKGSFKKGLSIAFSKNK